MTLFMLGVNILLLIAIWKFMVRKTILDSSRDQLFDLRDEVRATFVANGWDMDSKIYRNLRNLLNGHLRFTEEFSIWKIVFFNNSVRHQSNLTDQMRSQFEKVFAVDDPKQREFVLSIRRRSMSAVMKFAMFGSGFLLFLTVISAPIMVIVELVGMFDRGSNAAVAIIFGALRNFGRASETVMAASATMLSKHLVPSDLVERYSYRAGIA